MIQRVEVSSEPTANKCGDQAWEGSISESFWNLLPTCSKFPPLGVENRSNTSASVSFAESNSVNENQLVILEDRAGKRKARRKESVDRYNDSNREETI